MADESNTGIAGRGKNNRGVTSRLFWEEKAWEYGLPFKKDTLARTRRIISLLKGRGLSVKGARILDIGSGPGTFALPLASRGASVTALDISENMLKRLTEEAHRRGISGVETVRASWKDFDPLDAGFGGAFDIVLSALSLAIETEEDVLKMEQCSRQWCVCVATGKIRRHALCEKALQAFGVPLTSRPDIRNIRDILEQRGKGFSYESFPVVLKEKKTIPDLAEELAKRLEARGEEPDRERILPTVSRLFGGLKEDEAVECTWHSDRGVLMWRVDEAEP